MLDEGRNVTGAFLGGMEMQMMGAVFHLVELKVRIILGQNRYSLVVADGEIW